MATAVKPAKTARALEPEQRVVLRGVGWGGVRGAPEDGRRRARAARSAEVVRWVLQAETVDDHSEWGALFRGRVRAGLLPRHAGR